VLMRTVIVSAACAMAACGGPPSARPAPIVPRFTTPIFTPAHRSIAGAVSDFLGYHPPPVQPFAFPHRTHVEKEIGCTDYCHEAAAKGPVAGLPGVKTCMTCHAAIATDRPLIIQLAALEEKGIDLDWQRVFGYAGEAHVRFNHAPHLRGKVECATCHGDIAHQTVAQRNVDLHMGVCVDCHRAKGAPNECTTCHF
jgi:hypothetical protein